MEKTQAEAIAQAIMEPNLRAQEELRSKRALEAMQLARKRRVAWFALAGSAIGAGIAYSTGVRLTMGIVWGGFAGSALGWLITARAAA